VGNERGEGNERGIREGDERGGGRGMRGGREKKRGRERGRGGRRSEEILEKQGGVVGERSECTSTCIFSCSSHSIAPTYSK
jgi:hypothetical protein